MSVLVRLAARRALLAAASVLLVVATSLVLVSLAPGRFGDELGLDPAIGPEARARDEGRARTALADWMAGAARGDLGRSMRSGLPVGALVVARGRNTLLLTVPATLLAWGVALVVVGWTVRPAARPLPAWADRGLAVVQSVPEVVLALVLIRVAAATRWWPAGGMIGDASLSGAAAWIDFARHLTLPTLALALSMTPLVVRHVHAAVMTAAVDEVVRAALARGVRVRAIYWNHALRAAWPAIAPLAGVSVATLVEVVFAWPGLGALLVDAVHARDVPVVLGAVTAVAVVLVLANTAADLALSRAGVGRT
jgi:peptide/nickel transport system permease protein